MDLITVPTTSADTKVPVQLFDIISLLSNKIKNSSSQSFKAILWYASKLKSIPKYDISLETGWETTSTFTNNLQVSTN